MTCLAAGTKGTESRASATTDLAEAIIIQDTRSKACKRTEYARSCPPGALMVFEQTVVGCSPVGCYMHPSPDASELGDESAAREAIIRQTVAWLAEEQPETSLKSHFYSRAVEFERDGEENKTRMGKILKQRPGERDLPALRFLYEEAKRKGFVHPQIQKAADILAWNSSPAEVVLSEQAAASVTCSWKASGCPRDSFPLLAGCKVAACVHRSVVGADGLSTLAETDALERALPALLAAKDLKGFNKILKAMPKQREKASNACNEAIQSLLREGQTRWDGVDFSAVRFFVELADYEGYKGRGISDGRRMLDRRMVEIDAQVKATDEGIKANLHTIMLLQDKITTGFSELRATIQEQGRMLSGLKTAKCTCIEESTKNTFEQPVLQSTEEVEREENDERERPTSSERDSSTRPMADELFIDAVFLAAFVAASVVLLWLALSDLVTGEGEEECRQVAAPEKNDPLDWIKGFLGRHERISKRLARIYESIRVTSSEDTTICTSSTTFVGEFFGEHNKPEPDHIWDTDESAPSSTTFRPNDTAGPSRSLHSTWSERWRMFDLMGNVVGMVLDTAGQAVQLAGAAVDVAQAVVHAAVGALWETIAKLCGLICTGTDGSGEASLILPHSAHGQEGRRRGGGASNNFAVGALLIPIAPVDDHRIEEENEEEVREEEKDEEDDEEGEEKKEGEEEAEEKDEDEEKEEGGEEEKEQEEEEKEKEDEEEHDEEEHDEEEENARLDETASVTASLSITSSTSSSRNRGRQGRNEGRHNAGKGTEKKRRQKRASHALRGVSGA
eukprot:g10692.t1